MQKIIDFFRSLIFLNYCYLSYPNSTKIIEILGLDAKSTQVDTNMKNGID